MPGSAGVVIDRAFAVGAVGCIEQTLFVQIVHFSLSPFLGDTTLLLNPEIKKEQQ